MVTTCDAQSPNVLDPGGEPSLAPGACLISPNQQYELIMQTDGNLVLYYKTSAHALWSSVTQNNPGAFFRLQTNGFMGVLNSSNSATLWAPSEPWVGGPVNAVLVLQDDGNLVLYDTQTGEPHALWATNTTGYNENGVSTCDAQSPSAITGGAPVSIGPGGCLISPNQQYELIMQTDGNLVLYYQTSATPLWSTNTANNPGAYFSLPGSGAMAVYNTARFALWLPPAGEPWVGDSPLDTRFVVQDDGNVVLYDTKIGDVHALWATNTNGLQGKTLTSCGAGAPSSMGSSLLESGACLISPNQQYELIMQTDGNLVLYYLNSGSPEWATGTENSTGAFFRLQDTGSMAVLNSANSAQLWAPDEPWVGGSINPVLVVQDDGNVVLYNVRGGGVTALWATNTEEASGSTLTEGQTLHAGHLLTSPNGHVTLVMQQDGNLVAEFNGDGATVYWASGTWGNPGAFLALQGDGNLLLYQRGSTVGTGNGAIWGDGCPGCNQTYPQPGNYLAVQNDGNIVVYNASGKALWSSNSVVAASGDNLGSTMSVGQKMNGGDYMQSPNGEYQLYNRSNVVSGGTPGSLEIFTSVPSTGATCQMDQWGDATSIVNGNGQVTEAYADGAYLQLTSTGDLVYYYTNTESGTNVSWDAGVTGGSLLALQNDGNLVLYGTAPSPGAAAPVVWASGTNAYRGNALCAGETLQEGQYIAWRADYMILQTDGNLVVYPYDVSDPVQWASGTNGQGSDYAIQQTDGNFVVYHTGGGAIWSTATAQSTDSNSWTFQIGDTGVNNNNPGEQWALQVFNTGTGDYAWYADAKKPSGTLVKPPQTSQISHGAQAILNVTVFVLTG
jgi:hypothetical protein